MEEEDYQFKIITENRPHGRHLRVFGDAPEDIKRAFKYELFSEMNSKNYKKLMDILPKE